MCQPGYSLSPFFPNDEAVLVSLRGARIPQHRLSGNVSEAVWRASLDYASTFYYCRRISLPQFWVRLVAEALRIIPGMNLGMILGRQPADPRALLDDCIWGNSINRDGSYS